MKIEQLYTSCLAEAAYYIESEGEIAIIDPLRECEPYLEKAKASGGKIKYIFETHFHADFVSGHVDLAAKTGAQIVYGPNASTSFKSHIAKDGEVFTLGKITITVLHTPGHTLESSTYLLKDENGKPHCIFTGDTLFIGDVGRPDLAIKSDLTKEDLAGMMFDSLRNKIMTLPDDVIVYPAHGAGSSCGKNMSSETWSTLGEQKKTNYALKGNDKAAFVKELTTGIMPAPQYFAKNAALNKNGYDKIDDVVSKGNTALSLEAFDAAVKNGALILDVRTKGEFSKAFIPGSIFIGLEGTFAMWVGALITDLKQPLVLITPEGQESEAVLRLARVGYDNTVGYLKGGIETWKNAGRALDHVENITAEKLAELNPEHIVDVRKPGEYEAGHVCGAVSFPLDYINDHLNDLHKGNKHYIHCKSGYRSVIAISILKKQGYKDLVDVLEGYGAMEKTNIKLVDVCTKGA
ncbi:MAG TPA: MBL fold metallo-hydrolase [Flavobacteriales bacterium]|nr:MBL fold metallo-hydrolase [Flavobacteriales bacterium]